MKIMNYIDYFKEYSFFYPPNKEVREHRIRILKKRFKNRFPHPLIFIEYIFLYAAFISLGVWGLYELSKGGF